MAEELKCLKCGKRRASVKMTRIVAGKVHSIHLCEQCAAEISPYQQQALSLQEAIEKVLAQLVQKQNEGGEASEEAEADGTRCPLCGTTVGIYRKSFLLGCPQCYSTFEGIIEPQLRRLHGSTRHVGRAPDMRGKTADRWETVVEALKKELALAVSREQFELAARLRDHIRQIQDRADHVCPEMPEV